MKCLVSNNSVFPYFLRLSGNPEQLAKQLPNIFGDFHALGMNRVRLSFSDADYYIQTQKPRFFAGLLLFSVILRRGYLCP